MILDQSAVIFSVFFMSLLQAAFFFVQYFGRKLSGGNFFVGSHLLTGCGLMLYISRDIGMNPWISVVLANALMLIGAITFFIGMQRFMGTRENRLLMLGLIAILPILLVLYTFVWPSNRVRAVLTSLFVAVVVILAAIEIIRKCPPTVRTTGRFLAGCLFFFAGGHLGRVVLALLNLNLPGFVSSFRFDTGTFLVLMALGMIWTFCVTLMYNQQLIAESREAEEHFRSIFSLIPNILVISDIRTGKIVNVNEEFCNQTGYAREAAIGRPVLDLRFWAHPEDRDKVVAQIQEKGVCDRFETEMHNKDGSLHTVLFSGRLINLGGQPHMLSVTYDISDRIRMERDLYAEKELLQTTLLSIGDGVISTDAEGRIELMNRVAENLTGWDFEEAKGVAFDQVFQIVGEKSGDPCESPVKAVLREQSATTIADDAILVSRDGTERAVQDSAAPILDREGTLIGVVIVFRDFTEEKTRNRRIEYLSYHDQLTGLYNRRFFREELVRIDVPDKLPLTLVMADINGLKMANDAFGHRLGDEIIITTAELLREGFRKSDTVSRIGGDEFVAILPQTDAQTAEKIVNRIREKMEGRKIDSVLLSVSFGWHTKTTDEEVIADSFKSAEDRMYRTKLSESRSTRNRTLNVILHTLYEKNKYEKAHAERVSQICIRIGKAMGLPEESVVELGTVGLLHDIGKIAVDDALLNSDRILDGKDRAEVERHAEAGYRILNSIEELSQTALTVMAHHERWDGTGYPKGLKGEQIPLFSRIAAVAEVYDELINDRPYRHAMIETSVCEELLKDAGSKFDPDIVRIFLAVCHPDKYSFVTMNGSQIPPKEFSVVLDSLRDRESPIISTDLPDDPVYLS